MLITMQQISVCMQEAITTCCAQQTDNLYDAATYISHHETKRCQEC